MKKLLLMALICLPLALMSAEAPKNNDYKKKEAEDYPALTGILKYAKEHQEFRNVHYKDHEKEFIRLVKEGQNHQVLLISCSDSRLVSDFITGTKPGTTFVIRNAGNFVPEYSTTDPEGTIATIQYGVEVLNVKHIIVCGHSHCGAIKGLFQGVDEQKLGALKKWLKWGEEAKKMTLLTVGSKATPEEKYYLAEHLSVVYQLEHLMSYPFIKSRVDSGNIFLHGWYYDIEDGEIEYYDPETYNFAPLNGIIQGIEKELRDKK